MSVMRDTNSGALHVLSNRHTVFLLLFVVIHWFHFLVTLAKLAINSSRAKVGGVRRA